jgi:tRNA-dihydrouridine synthase 1
LADWEKIKAVKEAVSIPVFANGNILYFSDIKACLDATGADAVMSAEGNLYNPALFRPSMLALRGQEDSTTEPTEHIPHVDLALEYLAIVKQLKTHTGFGAIKGHLFKILRPGLVNAIDLRNRMGKGPDRKLRAITTEEGQDVSLAVVEQTDVEFFEEIIRELKGRMEVSAHRFASA